MGNRLISYPNLSLIKSPLGDNVIIYQKFNLRLLGVIKSSISYEPEFFLWEVIWIGFLIWSALRLHVVQFRKFDFLSFQVLLKLVDCFLDILLELCKGFQIEWIVD